MFTVSLHLACLLIYYLAELIDNMDNTSIVPFLFD